MDVIAALVEQSPDQCPLTTVSRSNNDGSSQTATGSPIIRPETSVWWVACHGRKRMYCVQKVDLGVCSSAQEQIKRMRRWYLSDADRAFLYYASLLRCQDVELCVTPLAQVGLSPYSEVKASSLIPGIRCQSMPWSFNWVYTGRLSWTCRRTNS